MKISFVKSRQSFFLLFIILLIASAFTLYFFNYVDNKKDDLIQRNFGQLNAITAKIQQKVNGLSAAVNSSTNKNTINEATLKTQLYSLITDLRNVDISSLNNIIEKKDGSENERIKFKSANDSLFMEFSKTAGSYLITLKKSGINEILESKKNQDLFDDFFLVSDEGRNVVQLPKKIITITRIDSLTTLDGKASSFKEFSASDGVAKLTSGNKDYLLFTHPMQLEVSADGVQNQWVICGVVNADKFQSESYAISSNIILLFLVIIFLIVLAWPLLKLRFVSRFGHIRTYDITIASISITFAAAILTFTIVDFIVYDKLNQEVDQNLENLSAEIQNNFLNEVCLVHSELDRVTDSVKERINSSNDYKIYNFFSKGVGYTEQDTTFAKYSLGYKYFDLMHWSDASGEQQFKFLMKEKRTPFINIQKRKYFQSVIEEKLWKSSCSHPAKIFLQPVISLTTGDFSVSLSKEVNLKDGEKYVGAVDFLPVSVYSTILPAGFSFCIIDKNGDVLFHSNNDRNLAENFLNETDNAKFLNAAIAGRTKEKFTANYWGKNSRIMINPIKGLPWYTVVMFEKDQLRRNNLETASVSVFLFLLYISPFIILLLFFLILKGSSRNWVWPVGTNENVYKKLLLCYILYSLVLMFIYFFSSNQAIIFISTWIFPHSALILTGIIIILKLQKSSAQTEIPDKTKREWQFAAIIILLDAIVVLLIINSVKNISATNLLFLFLIWLVTIITSLLILLEIPSKAEQMLQQNAKPVFNLITTMKSFLKDKESLRRTSKWYGIAVTAFLILGSILPAAGFFSITYQTQIKLYIKQAQLDYFDKLEERRERIENYYRTEKFANSDELRKARINESSDIYISCFYQTKKDTLKKYSGRIIASTWFDTEIVHELLPQFGEAGLKPKVLTYNSADNFFSWYKNINDTSSQLILETLNPDNDSLVFVSNLPQLNDIFTDRSLIFWLFLFIAVGGGLVLFYFLIRYIMNHAFIIGADTLSYQKNYRLFDNKLQNHVLILSNNSTLAGEMKDKVNGQVINIPDIINEQYDPELKKSKWICQPEFTSGIKDTTLILNGFEFGYSNSEINNLKLSLISDLIYSRKCYIIIISSIHPLGGFSFAQPDASREIKQNILNSWKDILGGFIFTSIHHPVEEIEILYQEKKEFNRNITLWGFVKSLLFPSSSKYLFIKQELVNKNVKMFHPEIFEVGKELIKIAEEKNLNFSNVFDLAMDRTRSYHRFLWGSCSIDEKLVLVRLAQDRFVPVSNLSTVETLLRRGILKREPNLKTYNTFFTHFVLEANHPEEEYWDEQNSQSGWNKFRTPILIILVGIMIFLFSTQSEIYSNTLAIITSTSILIPAALRLLGIFQTRQAMSKSSD